MKSDVSIAVMYLARKAEGRSAFQSFLRSYAEHPAGITHDLVILLKGYDDGNELDEAKALFSPYTRHLIAIPDEGFDLDSYYAGARSICHEFICCFNTFSTILDGDWLEKFYLHASQPDVGIVGATASFESNRDALIFFQRVAWQHMYGPHDEKRDALFAHYFDFVLKHLCFPTPGSDEGTEIMARNAEQGQSQEMAFQKWWELRCLKIRDFAEICSFPSFPNPHIRTNAFMMRRRHFLETYRIPGSSKLDTSHMESGTYSITRQILRRDLRAQIVGRNGVGYDVVDWPSSGTFRLQSQKNLLIADNRTRDFDNSSKGWQTTHAWLAWGTPTIPLPSDFPHLGVEFRTPNESEIQRSI